MPCRCHIIPSDVLDRFANDETLTKDERNKFADTYRLDNAFRKLRIEAVKLTMVARSVAPNVAALASSPAINVYDCGHTQTLPGAQVPNPKNSNDPVAVRVFNETEAVADFYSRVFSRNSIDNAGMTLISSIHYGINYNNAFWNGSQMTYGDGDGQIFVDFSMSNDVICHELTHGITQYTLGLNYSNEPGGLNESISDCFGSMFRQWQSNQDVNQADWLIGKDIMGPAALQRGYKCLRDLSQPDAKHCLAAQPTHYNQYKSGMDPHYSSGIPNLAFYTTCMGVGGNSWDKVGQIWYHALIGNGAKPNMRMKTFANLTRKATGQLYPGDVALAGAVDAGWKKVGL